MVIYVDQELFYMKHRYVIKIDSNLIRKPKCLYNDDIFYKKRKGENDIFSKHENFLYLFYSCIDKSIVLNFKKIHHNWNLIKYFNLTPNLTLIYTTLHSIKL